MAGKKINRSSSARLGKMTGRVANRDAVVHYIVGKNGELRVQSKNGGGELVVRGRDGELVISGRKGQSADALKVVPDWRAMREDALRPPKLTPAEARLKMLKAELIAEGTSTPVALSPRDAEHVEEDAAKNRLVKAFLDRVTKSGGALQLEQANGSAAAVIERMLAAIPGANVHDELVGPFYDTTGLRKWFDMSRQTLDAQARAGDVLCVMSGDNQRLYPSFQFDASGNLLPRLREVMAVLDPEHKALWGDAIWLNAPTDDLDGMTPAEALRSDRADDAIRLAAQAGAFRLA